MLRIHQKVGQKSRIAGLTLSLLSLAFLGLSLYFRNNIIFQIDSIVCLLAAIAVFLRGDKNSIQLRIANKMLQSSSEVLDELSSLSFGSTAIFSNLPLGDKVTDVVVSTNVQTLRPATLETSTDGRSTSTPLQSNSLQSDLIPPGRSLAELYQREIGLVISTDLLIQSLRTIICERFELGSSQSVKQSQDGKSIEITLNNPAIRQSCTAAHPGGTIGCPISSMLAILFCHAARRIVQVDQCSYDPARNELSIILSFGPEPAESR